MNQRLQNELNETGALLFDASEVPLDDKQWAMLDQIMHDVEYEHVVGGDAGEGHSVFVSRFVNDVSRPVDLQPKATEVKDIVMNDEMLSFYESFIGTNKLCLRRCQANLLRREDYIGRHIDQHSNPDYIASVVFHFDSSYSGGDFVSQPATANELTLHPKPHSVVVNRGDTWHEVLPVTDGERRTLACFLSREFGKSRSARKEIEVASY